MPYSKIVKPGVAARACGAFDEARPDRVGDLHEYNRHAARSPATAPLGSAYACADVCACPYLGVLNPDGDGAIRDQLSLAVAIAGSRDAVTNSRIDYEARSLSRALSHACMNAHGAVRDKRYHVVTAFTNINGITVPPVNKSTIGYFKSVPVVRVSFRSPVIVLLLSEGGFTFGGFDR